MVALGHVVVELPYVLFLVYTMSRIRLGVIGERVLVTLAVLVIVYFSYLTIRDALAVQEHQITIREVSSGISKSSFILGVTLTAFNPYFLAWWVTVALPIVMLTAKLGLLSFIVMYAFHVWYDLLWLPFLAQLGKSSLQLLGSRGYRNLLLALGIFLLILALHLLFKAYLGFTILPF